MLGPVSVFQLQELCWLQTHVSAIQGHVILFRVEGTRDARRPRALRKRWLRRTLAWGQRAADGVGAADARGQRGDDGRRGGARDQRAAHWRVHHGQPRGAAGVRVIIELTQTGCLAQ